ncbi:MAG TPA: hypothetical protein VH328_03075, partial [Burkholderiaceae bacterium]|nr:hypothetical protein [Burkholderiaceae bacterium]
MNSMLDETTRHGAARAPARSALLLVWLGLATCCVCAQGRPHVLWSEAGHAGVVTSLALAPDGKMLATSSADRTVKLWRYPAATLLRTLVLASKPQEQVTEIDKVRFTPDGADVVAAIDRYDGQGTFTGVVAVFRAGDGALLRVFGHQPLGIASLDLSPDGRFVATAGKGGGVMVWRLADGKRVASLEGPGAEATDV